MIDFIKGEALRLLRTNSSQITVWGNTNNFRTRLQNRDYPAKTVERHHSENKFSDTEDVASTEKQNQRQENTILCNAMLPGIVYLIDNEHQLGHDKFSRIPHHFISQGNITKRLHSKSYIVKALELDHLRTQKESCRLVNILFYHLAINNNIVGSRLALKRGLVEARSQNTHIKSRKSECRLSNTTLVTKYIDNQNIPDLKFERSQETRRILFKGQHIPVVMTLVFRKRGIYCFKSQKTCALHNFKDRKLVTFYLSGKKRSKS